MDFVGSARWADVNPCLQMQVQVWPEVLRFRDTLAHLQNPLVYLLKLFEILEIIGALPAFYVGICHARGVTVAQLRRQFQQVGIERYPVSKQGRPYQRGEQRLGSDFHGVFLIVKSRLGGAINQCER